MTTDTPPLMDPGRRPDPEDERDHIYRIAIQSTPLSRPAAFRRRYAGPNLNQGGTPHCVTYATTSVKNRMEKLDHDEWLFGASEHEFAPGENPAAEWLYRYIKDNRLDPWPHEDGTNGRAALEVLSTVGLPGRDGRSYTIGEYARLTTVNQIMEAVYVHGPVLLGMAVDTNWWSPLDEHTAYCRLGPPNDQVEGGHEIEVVGYRDTTTLPVELQGLWVKNQWGSGWGYAGYVRIPFSHLNAYSDWDAWWLEDAINLP